MKNLRYLSLIALVILISLFAFFWGDFSIYPNKELEKQERIFQIKDTITFGGANKYDSTFQKIHLENKEFIPKNQLINPKQIDPSENSPVLMLLF